MVRGMDENYGIVQNAEKMKYDIPRTLSKHITLTNGGTLLINFVSFV